jgi:hypothetical protein
MSRALGRSFAAAALGALAGVVWLALFYGLRPAVDIDFDVDPPRLITGVYPVERDADSGLTFAWTGEQLTLRLPGLDRHVDWALTVRVRGARPEARENPTLTFLADGVPILTRQTTTDFEEMEVVLPQRPGRRGVTIGMRSSATFVPGPGDQRALGVMLDWVRLSAAGVAVPPRSAFTGSALTAGAAGAAIAMLGVTAGSAVGATILVAAGSASLIGRGFGPYTDFPIDAARASLAIGLALAGISVLVQRLRGRPFRNTARFVAAVSAMALLLKLLVLLHPDMPVGDAMFQAHRFQDVLGGKLYFTSIAPGNYLFPYAPGLYVFAAPFAALVRRGPADMALLRIIVSSVDAVVAIGLYGMIVHARGDRIAGAIAVALYHLIPLDFGVQAVGNLTNAFAQSVSVLAFAMMTAASLRIERRVLVCLFSVVLAGAFLSHTSTFAILAVTCTLVAALFWWRGGPALRSPALAIAIGLMVAVVIAVVLYYAHFLETYRTELARIGTETATAAPDAGGRGVADRLTSVPRYLGIYFGVPVLILTCWGAVALWRRGGADRLALSTTGWAIGCGLFLLLGVLTPVDMRYYLASIPAVAIVAAIGASQGWSDGGYFRIASALLLAGSVIVGLRSWYAALG